MITHWLRRCQLLTLALALFALAAPARAAGMFDVLNEMVQPSTSTPVKIPTGRIYPQGVPWGISGSMSFNWRNVGPREPGFETQIQNQVYLADMYFAFHGPAIDGFPFWMEFQLPTGSQGQPNLYQFYFESLHLKQWDFRIGKFLVPFGRYNELYRQDMFLTVTRPLLYASPDSLDLVVRLNSPRPIFSSGYTDIGARATYYPERDHVLIPKEITFFVVNGLSESSNRSRTFPKPTNLGVPPPPANGVSVDFGHENNNLADNNNNKTLGGRVVYSFGTVFLPWPIPEGRRDIDHLTLGLSALGGQYDLEGNLNNRVFGLDMAFEYEGFNITSEYIYNFSHFKSPVIASSTTLITPTLLARDFEEFQGYFVQASYPVLRKMRYGKRLTAVGVFNQMFRRGPELNLFFNQTINGTFFPSITGYNPAASRINRRIDKLTMGLNYQITEHLTGKLDYSYWFLGRATTPSNQTQSQATPPATNDVYQTTFSIVLSF